MRASVGHWKLAVTILLQGKMIHMKLLQFGGKIYSLYIRIHELSKTAALFQLCRYIAIP